MNIVVCVKQVPDSQDLKINPVTNTLDRSGATLIMNPADIAAIEAARALRKAMGGSIRAISMGPASAEEILLQTARKGIERLILATDPVFAGGDTFATATVLRAAITATGEFDIILCGRRAIDGETGQVGGELAALLKLPCLTNVIELQWKRDQLLATRLMEFGVETRAVPIPAVVTFCENCQERPPSLSELRAASRARVERLDAKTLQLDAKDAVGLKGSKTRVRRIVRPMPSMRGGKRTGDRDNAVRLTLAKISETISHAK